MRQDYNNLILAPSPSAFRAEQTQGGGFTLKALVFLKCNPNRYFELSGGTPQSWSNFYNTPYAAPTVTVMITAKRADGTRLLEFKGIGQCELYTTSFPYKTRAVLSGFSYTAKQFDEAGNETSPTVLPHPATVTDSFIAALQWSGNNEVRAWDYGTSGYFEDNITLGYGPAYDFPYHPGPPAFYISSAQYHLFLPDGAYVEASATCDDSSIAPVIYGTGGSAAYRPVAGISINGDNPHIPALAAGTELNFNGSPWSYDYDGTIEQWDWSLCFDGEELTNSGLAAFDYDFADLLEAHEGEPPLTFQIKLTETDNDGGISDTVTRTFMLTPENVVQIGTLLTPAGVLYSARNNQSGVQLARFPAGGNAGSVASREDLAVLDGYKNPSIWQRRDGAIHLAAQNRSDSTTRGFISRDGGRTFQ